MTDYTEAILDSVSQLHVDTRFNVYHELMAVKVQEILLVANPYDAYILEEDGSLASKIINEYHGLNLSRPPRLVHAASAEEALGHISDKRIDLVITMPNLRDMDPYSLGAKIKALNPRVPVVLLAHGVQGIQQGADGRPPPGIDQVFIWSGDSDLLLALVKNTEDRLNVTTDTEKAGVRVLILVEDSPLYRSFFLPLIYKIVVKQTQSVLAESLNEEHRLLKMRARPKILVAENHEQAEALYNKFKPYVFGVISDTRFPKCGKVVADAGLQLLSHIKSEIPHLPMLLMSSESENRAEAGRIGVEFIDKNAPDLTDAIRSFFLKFLGFGDFVFRQKDGREVGRAANFRELAEVLTTVDDEPIHYHASRNRFSNWFMARSEVKLASVLSRIPISDFENMATLRAFLIHCIQLLLKNRQRGIVARFVAAEYDPEISDFVKIGNGSLGGKARGLAFFSNLLSRHGAIDDKYPHIRVSVPQTLVITTELFDRFLDDNHLRELDNRSMGDDDIARRFVAAALPTDLSRQLAGFIRKVHYPLSVRSSSLLEDAYFHAFSGLYRTYMLPNHHPSDTTRLQHLETAIKWVYASAFFRGPRAFRQSTAHDVRRDSMAVMIQRIAGNRYDQYFYPALSGVAQSWNYYPVAPMRPADGIARIALGMGKAVEEGKFTLRFSPGHPQVLPQFSNLEDILANAQNRFYALPIRADETELPFHLGTILELRDVEDAADDPAVQQLASTYVPEEHRLRDSGSVPGVKIITFASVLKYHQFPLPELLVDLLALGQTGMGCAVEFEFCVNFACEEKQQNDFNVLQIRPMAAREEHADVHVEEADIHQAVFYSTQCLGHGLNRDIEDMIYVKPEAFDPGQTVSIAGEIGRLNRVLADDRRSYLLAGFGRWGSADRWLGIPVSWQDISAVGAMVEIRSDALKADASQGTHFFQHITSQGIPYLTVTEGTDDFVDWPWLSAQPAVQETTYLRHVRFDGPLTIKSDGHHGACAVVKPESGT